MFSLGSPCLLKHYMGTYIGVKKYQILCFFGSPCLKKQSSNKCTKPRVSPSIQNKIPSREEENCLDMYSLIPDLQSKPICRLTF